MAHSTLLTSSVLVQLHSGKDPSAESEYDLNVELQHPNDTASLDFNWVLDSSSLTIPKPYEKALRSLGTAVLKEALDAFEVLTKVYASRAGKVTVRSLDYQSPEQRFYLSVRNMDNYKVGGIYTDTHKTQKEIGTIIFLLNMLMSEMSKYGTASLLYEKILSLKTMQDDEKMLLEALNAKKQIIECMKQAQAKERRMSSGVVTAYKNLIEDAFRAYKDIAEQTQAEERIVTKWQNSRHEQNLMQLKNKERSHSWTRDCKIWEIELEERCHEELEEYINISQQDYYDEIQNWMDQYESTMETKEAEIYNLQVETEKLRDICDAKRIEYETRTKEIEDWLEYKRQKDEAEKLLALQIWAATKIQSWWRDVMFRRKLGPYRKHKGKRGKQKQTKTKRRPKIVTKETSTVD